MVALSYLSLKSTAQWKLKGCPQQQSLRSGHVSLTNNASHTRCPGVGLFSTSTDFLDKVWCIRYLQQGSLPVRMINNSLCDKLSYPLRNFPGCLKSQRWVELFICILPRILTRIKRPDSDLGSLVHSNWYILIVLLILRIAHMQVHDPRARQKLQRSRVYRLSWAGPSPLHCRVRRNISPLCRDVNNEYSNKHAHYH